ASSLAEVGASIVQTIAASNNWIAGSIWLCDNDCATLHCATTWEIDDLRLGEFQGVTRLTPLTNSVGLPGRVVSSAKAPWIPDVTRDKNLPRSAAAREAGLRGAFAFPLRAEGKIMGVLELFSRVIEHPDDDLIQMAEALGSQIGLFIQR